MEVDVKRAIAAIITTNPERAKGAPVFVAEDHEERESLATSLSVILQGAVHDLGNGTLIVVKH